MNLINESQPHPWSSESLYAKAQLYVEEMEGCAPDEWQFGLWSAMALELLVRAALSKFSPQLLAENSNWRNVSYALGMSPTAKRFSPTSISTKEALARLSELNSAFTEEISGFCSKHMERRNAEVHTGEAVFASIGTSDWLPRFFKSCDVLLTILGKSLDEFFSDPVSVKAMIRSLEDAASKAVQQDIRAYATVWTNKDDQARGVAQAQSLAWATKQTGHRVKCPACQCEALLQGDPSGPVTTKIEEDEVVQRQMMLPASFECVACGLKIHGYSKLSSCGLGDAYTSKNVYAASEFFGLHTEDELAEARRAVSAWDYEPDYNE
jgi:hypothetical protein